MKETCGKGEDFCQNILVRLGRLKGKIVGNPCKGIRKQQVHSNNKSSRTAEDRAHAYEKVSYILVEAFWVPAVVDISKGSVFFLAGKQLEFGYFVPEYIAHQQVAEFVNGSTYPGCNQNPFSAKSTLDVKVSSVLKKAEYYSYKNQRTCDIEGLKQA